MGATIPTYDNLRSWAVTAYQSNHADLRFGGFLGAEFRNITFTRRTRRRRRGADRLADLPTRRRPIRAVNTTGNLREAIRFDASFAAAHSNGAFNTYDAALSRVTAINQREFNTSVADGQHELRGWAALPALAWLAIVALVAVGGSRRLAAYR